jgi:hypothetical protein
VAPPESSAKPDPNVTLICPPAGMPLTAFSATTAVPTLPGTRFAGVTLVPVNVPTAMVLAVTAAF